MINTNNLIFDVATMINYRTARKALAEWFDRQDDQGTLRVSIKEYGKDSVLNFMVENVIEFDCLITLLLKASNEYNSSELNVKIYSDYDYRPLVMWTISQDPEFATVQIKQR